MTVTISKWGNSQGFRVPKDIVLEMLILYIKYTIVYLY